MIINDIPVGARVIFGMYAVRDSAPDLIQWIKVHNDNTLLSEYILDNLPFDAKEGEEQNSYGNNNYFTSNIDQFLNSSNEEWYAARHEGDMPPAPPFVDANGKYADKAGFLSNFRPWELQEIQDTMQTRWIEGERYTKKRKIYLPAESNLMQSAKNKRDGKLWSYFENRVWNPAEESEQCRIHAHSRFNEGYWWVSSHLHSRNSGAIGKDRVIRYGNPHLSGIGMRPATKLRRDTSIEQRGENLFEVIPKTPEQPSVSFHELLSN